MNFYKHHLGDYDGATAHLSWDEDCAYTRLMRAYYRREAPIAHAERYRLTRAQTKAQKAGVDAVLQEFFTRDGDVWRQKRCDEEIAAYQKKANANRENGPKGGRPPNNTQPTNNPDGFRNETQDEPTNNLSQKPEARSQEPEGSNNPQRSAISPHVAIATALRARGVKGATASNPTILEWAQKGVSIEHALEATRIAIEDRGKKNPSVGYLDPIVAELKGRNGSSHSAVREKPWFIVWSQIEAKGAALGITPQDGEAPPAFRNRVYAAAGVSVEQVERAERDFA